MHKRAGTDGGTPRQGSTPGCALMMTSLSRCCQRGTATSPRILRCTAALPAWT
eukprot:CAMPEP_0204606776 /NCGR_PEP_ID=MMETSP0661-20131031/59299_1 /ASSEMBLY_ACC=CAM_ASM_000606 /TAXON_ID=109239 /ORGANISM="Alexandrium margalefi, Strain AMGDE01CS-322" /LENGTH=52 /DNA_ID=CAMNT_0051618129 /DNA_START=108 /DNA_END=263 /DNA_ORIENTATION=-